MPLSSLRTNSRGIPAAIFEDHSECLFSGQDEVNLATPEPLGTAASEADGEALMEWRKYDECPNDEWIEDRIMAKPFVIRASSLPHNLILIPLLEAVRTPPAQARSRRVRSGETPHEPMARIKLVDRELPFGGMRLRASS